MTVPGLPSHPCFPRNQQRGIWESLSTVLSSADRDLKGQQLVMTVCWRWELGERKGKDTVTEVGGNDGEEGAPGESLVLTYFTGRVLKVKVSAFSYEKIFLFCALHFVFGSHVIITRVQG